MQSKPKQILHAIYGALPGGLCDIENILFNNVGMSHFTSLMSTGIRFERSYSYPSPPYDLATHSLHFHRYTLEEINKSFYYWQSHRTLATWDNVLIPRLIGKITAGDIWFHLRSATIELHHIPKQPLKQYGLSIIIKVPESTNVQLTNAVKPMIDGLASGFHAYQGSEVDQVSQRLGDELRQDPKIISHMLLQQNRAILGARHMVRPYRNHIKWNPADDLCLAAELLVKPHSGKDWQISGELYDIDYRETLT